MNSKLIDISKIPDSTLKILIKNRRVRWIHNDEEYIIKILTLKELSYLSDADITIERIVKLPIARR